MRPPDGRATATGGTSGGAPRSPSELTERPARSRSPTAGPRPRATSTTGCPATKVALGVELVDHPARPRLPVHGRRRRHRRAQQPVRDPLRPPRAGDPARAPRGADPHRARRGQGAGPPGGPLPRRRHRPRPGRLLPPALPSGAGTRPARADGGRRAGRGRRADPGDGRGRHAAGVPPSRRAAPAPDRRPRPAQPLRPGGVGARAHRDAVRLPLPDRDLHPGREAHPRLLRAAVPARRPDRRRGSTSRPTGGRGCCWSRGRTPSRARRRTPRRSWRPSWSGWPAGSASTPSSSSRAATWPRRCRRRWRPADPSGRAPRRIGPVPAAG